MDKNQQAHIPTLQKPEIAGTSRKKLTLKQRLLILSRKDRMGRAKPTFLRVLIFTAVLIAGMVFLNKAQINSRNSQPPTPVPVQENEAQISFVGDVMLGRKVADYGEKESYSELFRDAGVLWKNSSLVFANLENPIIRENETYSHPEGKNVLLSASAEALQFMAEAGVNAVALANNHMGDFGRKGIRHTIEALEACGLPYAGAGGNSDEAGACKVLEADGVTVGFLSCTAVYPEKNAATVDGAGVCTSSYGSLYRNVNEASNDCDLLVVYMHVGGESALSISDAQQRLAHQLIESGANIVIGSNPNILQSIEQYKDGIIFYSLGCFVFDQLTRAVRNTAMVQLNVDKTTGEGCFTVIPMRVNDFHPYETTNGFYVSQIHRALLEDLPESAYSISEDGRIQIPMKLFDPGEPAKSGKD